MVQPPKTMIWGKPLYILMLLCLTAMVTSGCIHSQGQLQQQSPAAARTLQQQPPAVQEASPAGESVFQMAAGGTEDRSQKTGVRSQESEDRSQESGEKTVQPAAASKPDIPTPAPQQWKKLARRPRPAKDSAPIKVELAFDNADLYEVLDTALFELYHVDYMIDPSIKAKVTFHLSGSYTRNQFINIINNILQLSNLAIVRGPGHLYKIVRRNSSAADGTQPAGRGSVTSSAGDVTRLIKLRYLSAATALTSIRPFLSKGATMVQSTVTNDLILSDTPENITKAASLLSLLDVPYFEEITWRVFPVIEVDAQDLAADLGKIIKSNGLYNRPGINQGNVEILPIKTMNALLVISRWPEMVQIIEEWLQALDHAQDAGSNVFVYFVENGSAVELADILKQLFGGTASGGSNRTTIVQPVKKPGGKTATTAKVAGELSGEVDIIPDETNNAIVFKATPRDYRIIHKVLQQLDIIPRQVLINVMVAEFSLSGKMQFGIEWFLQGHDGKGYTVQGTLDNKISRPINTPLGTATGFTLGVYDGVDFMRGMISALGTDSDVNILSSPNILAVDNKEALIEVGKEVPTVTGQITDATSGSTVTNTIQYRKTGVILKVTPHINSSGLVKIELSQEVSDVGEYDSSLNTYTILNRKVETSLVVHDGQTIVLGGLIKNNQNFSDSGIPFLKDIPGLGFLFKSSSRENNKTELVLILTPHVINNRRDVDLITREFARKVERIKETFEAGENNK